MIHRPNLNQPDVIPQCKLIETWRKAMQLLQRGLPPACLNLQSCHACIQGAIHSSTRAVLLRSRGHSQCQGAAAEVLTPVPLQEHGLPLKKLKCGLQTCKLRIPAALAFLIGLWLRLAHAADLR